MMIDNYSGEQTSTFFLYYELQKMNLAVRFILNSDMYTEFFNQAAFQRYREIYMCKKLLYVLMKQAEAFLKIV